MDNQISLSFQRLDSKLQSPGRQITCIAFMGECFCTINTYVHEISLGTQVQTQPFLFGYDLKVITIFPSTLNP